ncbi:maleylpyruvate isomerase N-terminal domain-containing protein [Streptomyces globisporus]|uniref:maleylpyruvate isomerase N-terminal domain-containing protein n=1 Tax=Streptomyces globisporus TaxID=1908 RepID=UPI001F0C310E|nr:maleylpyruvate isomerase N-terminal domain-containing protein [Streptomyces globisporus]
MRGDRLASGHLDAPSPPEAEISAVEYYRPDDRFSPQTNGKRIALAQDRAARPPDGGAFAEDFAATWRRAYRLCRDQPGGRTVRTRHGGAMLLSEFVLTRVVEVAVHGLDLADALGREAWLTPATGDAAPSCSWARSTPRRPTSWGGAVPASCARPPVGSC